MRVSLFGGGRVAAIALRGRVLQCLGAEPEWTEGDHDDYAIRWTAGPATTFLCVENGPDDAPDLAVLRVVSPVATVGDVATALGCCNMLNTHATTNRWMITPGSYDGVDGALLLIGCSFVVGAHNRTDLEAFVTWCVREQIATAAEKMTSDLARRLGGRPCVGIGRPGAACRDPADWNEVVRHYDRVAGPGKDRPGDDLANSLQAAFLGLREEMLAEGTGAWSSPEADSWPLLCEMPATWQRSPGGEIHWDPQGQGSVPTVPVKASLTTWGSLGNGLLISMCAPGYHVHSADAVNRLNRLDERASGATHFVGAWARSGDRPVYLVFLSVALLEQDIAWPAVMREILLTFARQAQLARRVVPGEDARMAVDDGSVQPVGFQAVMKPHGLAWGETGQGRNPVAWHLDRIYGRLVGDDEEWAYPAANGFTWWPHRQAQEITVIPREARGDTSEVMIIRVATEVRVGVPDTPAALVAIARRNASLPESALVRRDDGTLLLAFQQVVSEVPDASLPEWTTDLAIRQFVMARELGAELAGLGTEAASAHPISGPRPEPGAWSGQFGQQAPGAAVAERDDAPERHPQVALIAASGQYALPYRMTARGDGGLEFAWRPGHTPWRVPADPEVRVTVTPGTTQAAPAWIVRTRVPVTGGEAEKARWCNDRNAALLLDPDPSTDLMVIGGWGLTDAGECCLTGGQSRRLVRDDRSAAARYLGHLLREEQCAVVAALLAASARVPVVPLTVAELAAGLDTVRAAFGRILTGQPDLRWALGPGEASVFVTCGKTCVEVPVGYGRPQLALIYGELLASSPNGRYWLSARPLLPDPEVSLALGRLERGGHLWRDEDGNWVFDAGHARARLQVTRVADEQRFGAAQAVRVAGLPGDPEIGRAELVIPPAQCAWVTQDEAAEVLAWAGRRIIGQVRHAAQLGARPAASAPPGRPRLFGSGRFAAAALRARLLGLLGAEPEWLLGDHDSPGIVWNSGLATTVFEVAEGAAATPDLGVLRIWTPVATAGNGNAARDACLELNESTGTVRWSVAREQDPDGSYYDEVQASCAFVVGPHNQDTLESFALWCVREQIAAATGHIRSGNIAESVSGVFSRYTGFPAGDERADWHPVTSFTDHVVAPSASLSAAGLAGQLHEAYLGLRSAMFDEGISTWFAVQDEPPLTCEMPFAWEPYPYGIITRMRIGDDDQARKPLTALLETAVAEHPALGNGLLITVHVPCGPQGHAGRAINEVNRLDAEVTGASHSFGGWAVTETAASDTAPGCVIFLPAAFAESVANLPLVMREILLTLARQALLARRVLVPAGQRSAEDHRQGLGLAVAADPFAAFVGGPHGLAWGETGEGRNPAARVLDQIYDKCIGPDVAWADSRTDGFTWWPYRQAQDITATLRGADGVAQGVSIRIATQVRRGVPVNPGTLRIIALVNAELAQSALVLGEDGLLFLACRLFVHEGTDHWANQWAQMLAADQFIVAREVSAWLSGPGGGTGFGEEAVSGHPFSGMRSSPDELFGIREDYLIGAASAVTDGLAPLVPLLALCRLYALPLDMRATASDGGLSFTWRPSQTHAELPVDPVVSVSVRHGDTGSGPGWIIRSVVPVAGGEEARARWCNERNSALLGDGDDSGDERTVVGGWGLAADGECCLTTWISPFFVPSDEVMLASGLVGNVLSYHASVVMAAIGAAPGAVTGAAPVTPAGLAQGLSSVLASFGRLLRPPAAFRWSAEAGADDVVVTLAGPTGDSGPGEAAIAEAGEEGLRTVLRIPLARNRPELGLLYAAFLGRSQARVRSLLDDLIPGELQDWDFTRRHIEDGLGVLDDEGILDWVKAKGAFAFDAGPAVAFLRFERLEDFRPYGGTALRFTATVPDLEVSSLGSGRASDGDVLGTWRPGPAGASYTVTIPPAGLLFGSGFVVEEVVTWVGRHMVTHVRKALAELGSANAAVRPDVSWRDLGNGAAAIMSGTELVASFSAQFLTLDKYEQKPSPDRSEQARRMIGEGTSNLTADEEGQERLEAWVAREWQEQLDKWWLFGEPVFWCEHIAPDGDEQPVMEWFMRFPAAMACDQCASRIRVALRAANWATACSSCGLESTGTAFGRTPGLSVVANYELCGACSELFTG